ncbi:DVU_1556 family methyltransferase [Desulfosporosinus sp. FKA]|uniref:DVU_1556 family methyltransferase n=1 Tax=Desulfosporosinus sp. FKA TaxID=1969834 RepID=UPI000B49B684|nr:class I SAM-dependent methyltransferase [Desulfosporosinus sp. FKA]
MNNNVFKVYEGDALRQATGDTLRPGGFFLTDLGVKRCNFLPGAKVLDVGSGSGATVERLISEYQLQALGIDPSEVLLEIGKRRNPDLNLIRGWGEELPFPPDDLDGVFAECTLSVMEEPNQVLKEIFRVLKQGGRLIINDVYARNPDGLKDLRELGIESCIRRALTRDELLNMLNKFDFQIVDWSDHTNLLIQLTVDLIMTHGSMTNFWLKSASCLSFVDPNSIQEAVKKAKMGYFQLIAHKGYQFQ